MSGWLGYVAASVGALANVCSASLVATARRRPAPLPVTARPIGASKLRLSCASASPRGENSTTRPAWYVERASEHRRAASRSGTSGVNVLANGATEGGSGASDIGSGLPEG